MASRLPAFIFAALLQFAGPASAQSFSTDYSVSLRGIPIGTARLEAVLSDGRYAIRFSGRVKGLARLFSDGKGSAVSSGEMTDAGLEPREYRHDWTEDDETQSVRIVFDAAGVVDVAIEPPPRRPERDVPVTSAHKREVVDPASALLWPAPAGAVPETCERTLPVFNGRQRFDLAFAYSRSETFRAGDGSYSGPAIVCAMRYRPIAGYRPDKDSIRFMAANRELEVWMAPVGGGVVTPVQIRIRSKLGRLVLEARTFAVGS